MRISAAHLVLALGVIVVAVSGAAAAGMLLPHGTLPRAAACSSATHGHSVDSIALSVRGADDHGNATNNTTGDETNSTGDDGTGSTGCGGSGDGSSNDTGSNSTDNGTSSNDTHGNDTSGGDSGNCTGSNDTRGNGTSSNDTGNSTDTNSTDASGGASGSGGTCDSVAGTAACDSAPIAGVRLAGSPGGHAAAPHGLTPAQIDFGTFAGPSVR